MTVAAAIPSSNPSAPFVRLVRVMPASREEVWDAWTKPEILRTWWGPRDNVVTIAELDVREGGELTIADRPAAEGARLPGLPREVIGRGVYTQVVPLERLQFTLTLNWGTGETALITVDFRDAEGGTEVTVVHENVQADYAWAFEAGWSATLEKLGEVFPAKG